MKKENDYLHELAVKISSPEFVDAFVHFDSFDEALMGAYDIEDAMFALCSALNLTEEPYYLGEYKVNEENLEKYLDKFGKMLGYEYKKFSDGSDTMYSVTLGKTEFDMIVVTHQNTSTITMNARDAETKDDLYCRRDIFGFDELYQVCKALSAINTCLH